MNSIILCEDSTDYTLIQYYMRKAHNWEDNKTGQGITFKVNNQKSRKLFKDRNSLTIAAVGGCSRLNEGLRKTLDRNNLAAPGDSEFFSSIVIITDHDEIETEQDFIKNVKQIFQAYSVQSDDISNNKWVTCNMINSVGVNLNFRFLLLVVPFEQKGAMETFLLNAIAESDGYDRNIINQCDIFVDGIDPEKKYLSKRRLITKAKFDTYFSVRTAAEQFNERQNILKSVKWEEYTTIQQDFQLLEEL